MEAITAFVIELVQKYPSVASIFMIIGILRAVFKPIFSVLEAYVQATPSLDDDLKLDSFKNGKIYAAIVWFFDFFGSVKLPK